ncbi:hypothetical protein ACFFX0_25780 [Citricoccus parietis]|uniref:Uncharacterized protein n=1 Tax=Citricoccus parietis TaxID=592307 RepID=A0ABV5G650_9MICC
MNGFTHVRRCRIESLATIHRPFLAPSNGFGSALVTRGGGVEKGFAAHRGCSNLGWIFWLTTLCAENRHGSSYHFIPLERLRGKLAW